MRQTDRTRHRPAAVAIVPLAWGASLLVTGLPYWSTPYRSVSLPGTLVTPGLFVIVLAAAVISFSRGHGALKQVAIVGLSVPAVVVARVTWDVMRDPTSHNLWPFEVVIALMIGFGCAVTGAVAGMLAARVRGEGSIPERP